MTRLSIGTLPPPLFVNMSQPMDENRFREPQCSSMVHIPDIRISGIYRHSFANTAPDETFKP